MKAANPCTKTSRTGKAIEGLLNLAVQDAAPFGKVGIVTGVRQCVMQMGGAIGLALFGLLLSNVLAAELRGGLAPLVAQLPPAACGDSPRHDRQDSGPSLRAKVPPIRSPGTNALRVTV